MFDHGPSACEWPTIHLAAVGSVMTTVTGEVADGMNTHGFTTGEYVHDVTLPRLGIGLLAVGPTRALDVVRHARLTRAAEPRLDC